ncbi:MAG: hypothetical protein JKX68_10975 [Flavobacteriales bacterium]|nr:hypothetical protein [Flavobacteriales bacterium]
MNNTPCPKSSLIRAILIAAAMLITSGMVTLAQSMGFIENHLIIKVIGITFGLILIVTANYFPKQLFPHSASNAQRKIAWLFAIAGLLYITVWITGDTQRTRPIFSLMFAPACILSMLMYRYANPNLTPSPSPETQS